MELTLQYIDLFCYKVIKLEFTYKDWNSAKTWNHLKTKLHSLHHHLIIFQLSNRVLAFFSKKNPYIDAVA